MKTGFLILVASMLLTGCSGEAQAPAKSNQNNSYAQRTAEQKAATERAQSFIQGEWIITDKKPCGGMNLSKDVRLQISGQNYTLTIAEEFTDNFGEGELITLRDSCSGAWEFNKDMIGIQTNAPVLKDRDIYLNGCRLTFGGFAYIDEPQGLKWGYTNTSKKDCSFTGFLTRK